MYRGVEVEPKATDKFRVHAPLEQYHMTIRPNAPIASSSRFLQQGPKKKAYYKNSNNERSISHNYRLLKKMVFMVISFHYEWH